MSSSGIHSGTHIPRPEDYPVMPMAYIGFFNEHPANDVPPFSAHTYHKHVITAEEENQLQQTRISYRGRLTMQWEITARASSAGRHPTR
jgi:hypothetical protein